MWNQLFSLLHLNICHFHIFIVFLSYFHTNKGLKFPKYGTEFFGPKMSAKKSFKKILVSSKVPFDYRVEYYLNIINDHLFFGIFHKIKIVMVYYDCWFGWQIVRNVLLHNSLQRVVPWRSYDVKKIAALLLPISLPLYII